MQQQDEHGPRDRQMSKLDDAQDSIGLNMKKYRSEKPFTMNLNQLINQNLEGPRRTMQLKLSEPIQSDFRQRIISSYTYQQNLREPKNDILSKKEISIFLPTEQEVKKQEIAVTLWRKQGSTNWLLCGQKHSNSILYARAVHATIHCEDNEEMLLEKELVTYESLIQNIQIADRYINDYGLFYILREGLRSLNVQFLMSGDSQSVNPSEQEEEQFKGRPLIQSNLIMKSHILGFQDLPYLASTYSLLKFQCCFYVDQQYSYNKLKQNFQLLKQLQSLINDAVQAALNKLLCVSEIYWFRVNQFNDKIFMLEFTLPTFTDRQEQELLRILGLSLPDCEHIASLPLVSPLEMMLQYMDPWFNREFKTEQIWRYYALRQQESTDVGYINLFFENDDHRQDKSMLGMSDGVLIASNYTLLQRIAQPRWIEVRAYEESKRYQVVLKVGFDRQKTIAPKSGDVAIDTGAYVSPTLDHIKVQGFLVHELEIV